MTHGIPAKGGFMRHPHRYWWARISYGPSWIDRDGDLPSPTLVDPVVRPTELTSPARTAQWAVRAGDVSSVGRTTGSTSVGEGRSPSRSIQDGPYEIRAHQY